MQVNAMGYNLTHENYHHEKQTSHTHRITRDGESGLLVHAGAAAVETVRQFLRELSRSTIYSSNSTLRAQRRALKRPMNSRRWTKPSACSWVRGE
jgi:hypothetical protein